MLDDLFSNRLWDTGLEFRRWEGYPGYPSGDGCVLLVPGRYWSGHESEISTAVGRYKWLLLIVTGDEEAAFDATAVTHANCRTWIQTPRDGKTYPEGARFFGVGYTPHMRNLSPEPPDKSLDVFLSAQRTHSRRQQAFDALKDTPHQSCVIPTQGFTQGLDGEAYAHYMVKARVAPAPSGAVSVDSFRAWEALESHAIPVLDAVSPVDGPTQYWERVLPGAPAPIVRDYKHLPEIVAGLLEGWPANANRAVAYWMRYKRRLSHWLVDDLTNLGAI